MKTLKNELKVMSFFIMHCVRFSKPYVILTLISSVLVSTTPLINVLAPRFIIDELAGAMRVERLAILVGLIVILNLIFGMALTLIRRKTEMEDQRLTHHFRAFFSSKVMNVSFEKVEDPIFIDQRERAILFAQRGIVRDLVSLIPMFISQIVTLVGAFVILLTFDVTLILIMIVFVVINVLITARFQKLEIVAQKDVIKLNKFYVYYIELLADVKVGLEARVYGFKKFLQEKSKNNDMNFVQGFLKIHKIRLMPSGLIRVFGGLQVFTIFFVAALLTINHSFTLGQFLMAVSAAAVFNSSLFEISAAFLRLRENCRYLEDFMLVCDVPDQASEEGTEVLSELRTIEFENVSFKYPKSERFVLRNVNLRLNAKESLSIVGENGAGKTTLIKLLARLYEPTEGRILVNGQSIHDFSLDSYRRAMAVVFQDFKIFDFTIRENISFDSHTSDDTIEASLRSAGLLEYVQTLPNKFDTVIGKRFDESGTQLSGGQNQKLAIARASFRDASIVILDEPTAALDPLAEAEIYEKFNELKQNKLTVYISHRLSSCRFSDRIIFMRNGTIVEEGTHDELMDCNVRGEYSKMFRLQGETLKKN